MKIGSTLLTLSSYDPAAPPEAPWKKDVTASDMVGTVVDAAVVVTAFFVLRRCALVGLGLGLAAAFVYLPGLVNRCGIGFLVPMMLRRAGCRWKQREMARRFGRTR